MTGGAQDYNYIWGGCLEITIEMSCCKYPPAAELPGHWEDHRLVILLSINLLKFLYTKPDYKLLLFCISILCILCSRSEELNYFFPVYKDRYFENGNQFTQIHRGIFSSISNSLSKNCKIHP
jgi:hypothetical protein